MRPGRSLCTNLTTAGQPVLPQMKALFNRSSFLLFRMSTVPSWTARTRSNTYRKVLAAIGSAVSKLHDRSWDHAEMGPEKSEQPVFEGLNDN